MKNKKPLVPDADLMAVLDAREPLPGMKPTKNRTLEAFQNAGTGKKVADVHLYDAISYWTGNDARSFKERLDRIDAETINLHINSPGGAVFEGVTIYNMLIRHKARIIVHIDGLAASIASVIAMAGDEVRIAENALMMIHNPSVVTWGESTDLRKSADVLDAIKEAILNTYETATGMDRKELATAMDNETYYSAQEAVDKGFATLKVSAQKAAAFWSGEDFPDIPQEARQLFAARTGNEDPPPPEQKKEAEVVSMGTVDDVIKARNLVATMRRSHGLG